MFSSAPSRQTLRFEGNKINDFPRDQCQYVICYTAGNFEARNSLNLAVAVTAVVG